MSKKSSGAKHVQNPTGTPMWDEYNGMLLLFQPNQSLNAGTYDLVVENGKRVMRKVSADKANNVTVVPPGWFESHFVNGGARASHGLDGLEIIEMRVDTLVAQNAKLKQREKEADAVIARGAEISAVLAQLESAAAVEGAVSAPLADTIAKVKGMIASMVPRAVDMKKK